MRIDRLAGPSPLLLAFGLGLALLAPGARAGETIRVAPGGVRRLIARHAKPVAFRVANLGDCSVGIVARDSFRHPSVNALLRPGEVRDFRSPSAEVMFATLVAHFEGTAGAILEVGELASGQEVRLPAAGSGFPCSGGGRILYTSGDGVSVPEVAYLVRNDAHSDCAIQVLSFPPQSSTPRIDVIDVGEEREVSGPLREIQVSGAGGSEGSEFVAHYTRIR